MARSTEFVLESARLDDAWDAFVEASPEGSVYTSAAFLSSLHTQPILYRCYSATGMAAAIVLTRQRDQPADLAFAVYDGILTAATGLPTNSAASVLESFPVHEFIVSELMRRHDFLDMQLAPSFADARPFLWHNYGAAGPRFTVNLRYTNYLDIGDRIENEAHFFNSMRRSRKGEIKVANRLGVESREAFDLELCVELFRKTLMRQQIELPSPVTDQMIAVVRALHGAGTRADVRVVCE